jgi:putative transposase
MGQSLVQIYTHIVFSTKHRQSLITPLIEHELHRYIGGVCKALECYPVIVGGYCDHLHILCLLSKKVAVVKLVSEIKTSSSKWVKMRGDSFADFYWQDGYGAFSVRSAEVDFLKGYIERQHKHHSECTFQNEYRSLLKNYQIEFDERYVWD